MSTVCCERGVTSLTSETEGQEATVLGHRPGIGTPSLSELSLAVQR